MDFRRFYEDQAKKYDSVSGSNLGGRDRKVSGLFKKHLNKVRRLLDVGCGVGVVSAYLGGLLGAEEIWGLDISSSRVLAAKGKGVRAILADLNSGSIPFLDSTFDAIFCGEVIEHLLDPDALLSEIRRVLQPEGLCIITTPNLASWMNRFALFLGWQPFHTAVSFHNDVGRPGFVRTEHARLDHLRVFTYRALVEFVRLHGFRIVDVRGETLMDSYGDPRCVSLSSSPNLARILLQVDELISGIPSLSNGIILAMKRAEPQDR
jgi:2-polyprenyl-3-methyl-5-hydroxy-6-metoxy-1,4-benzoquinol methylase